MEEHRRDQRVEATCAVIVTSDARRPETDETGREAIRILEEAGHRVETYMILRNEVEEIRKAVSELIGRDEIQVVITSGGTGISSRDKTIDAVQPILEKRIDGFGELFRRLSYEEIGEAAILSRATAGIAKGKLIVCLPGSRKAMELGLKRIIIPALGHILWEASR
ncbi:MogA/MoaB family molybdenum cofactor biosynthesis protein [Candidatus Bathyarchaeota archaeon]|nr:MogA/MoaB family molybdenum cofactor biosynthesis protein [Candidatus Bathyarchaeota archaeon]